MPEGLAAVQARIAQIQRFSQSQRLPAARSADSAAAVSFADALAAAGAAGAAGAAPGTGAVGKPVMPVQGVDINSLQTHSFNNVRDSGKHAGVDIFAKKGTPVVAAMSGELVEASWNGPNPMGGNRVWIKADDGTFHYYAHLDSITVKNLPKGTRVQAGQQIGTVGDSGNAKGTPPHLHFSVNWTQGGSGNGYKGENPVGNPVDYLRTGLAGMQTLPR